MQFKPVYNIAPKNSSEVDIYLYGVIGDSYWEEGNTASRFVRDFKLLESQYDRINTRINGPGGSIWEGLPIHNVIKASEKDTHTYNDGICFSMCAMILLSGKTVHAAKGSLVMLHNALSCVCGNADDMRKEAESMDVYDTVLAELIADKTGKTVEEVKALWMDYKDHYMTATEAYEFGLVDVLENYATQENPDNVKNMKHADIVNLYRAAPAAIATTKILTNNADMKNPFKDNFPGLTNLVGKAAGDVNAEAVASINAQITAQGIQGVTMVLDSDIEEMSKAADRVTELENTVSTHETTINNHVATIAVLNKKLGAPAEEPATPAADAKKEAVTSGLNEPTNQFETSVDREVRAALGK